MSRKKIDKKGKKEYNMLDFILLGMLISLVIVVLGLGIYAVTVHNKNTKNSKVDMAMPIIEETANTLYLDLGNSKKGDKKTYLLKIKNHFKDKINKEEYTYKISFTSDVDIKLSLHEKGSDKSLLDKKTVSTEALPLMKDKVDEHIYEIKIELNEDVDANSRVYLKIEGKKKNGNN